MKYINKDNRFSKDDSRLHIVREHAEIFLNKWKNETKDDRTMIALARLAELIGFTYTQEQPPLLQKLDTFFETSRNLLHKFCGVTEDDLQPVGSFYSFISAFSWGSVNKQEIYDIPHSTYHVAENLMKKMKKKSFQIPCMTSIVYDLVYCRTLNKQDLNVFPDELKNDEKLKEIVELSQPLSPAIVHELVENKVAISVEKYSHLFLAELYVSLIYSYGRNYFYHDRKTLKKPSFYVDLMKLAYCLANEINKELESGIAVFHGYVAQKSALLYLLFNDDWVKNDKLVAKTAEVRKKDLENAIKCYKQLSNNQQLFFEMGILKERNGDELFCYCEILKCYGELLAMPLNTLDDVELIRKDGSDICRRVIRKLKLHENQECQKGKLLQRSKYRNAVANFYMQLEKHDTQESFYKQAIEMFAISAENASEDSQHLHHLEAVVGLANVYSRIGRIRFTALVISFRHLKQCKSNENLREMLQQKPEVVERIRKIHAVNIVRAIAHLRLKKQAGMPRILDEQQRIPETNESTPDTSESTPDTSESTPDTSESTPDTSESTPETSKTYGASSTVNCPSTTSENEESQAIEKYLMNLAKKIPGDWKDLAIFLNISDEKIEQIEIDERGVVWQGYTMLKYWWKSRHKKKLWYEELATAIIASTENRDLAEKIKKEGPDVPYR
ncbi:uncharacterized protein LOC124447008 [Xenia sp. Carnegie-2017]|uniref:uncharacterized protein LOC124447008 n=1 Tax=Xenia sp. Carnegie-2017 TaxID=2897299 RepID=UPI001F04E47B|nr:uncharacterized protein LOC124447008 [Xenia sp. Carnegie-2017]